MSIPEEIEQLKTRLSETAGERGQAELLLEILQKYTVLNSTESQPYIDHLFQIAEKLNSPLYRAWSLYYLAVLSRFKAQYELAIHFSQQALLLFEQELNKKGIASAYNNIGVVHWNQGNYPDALKYHFAALKIREERGDKKGIANSYNNIGNVFFNQGDYPKALTNYFALLKITEEIGSKNGMASAYTCIGVVYHNQGKYPEALESYFAALKIQEETGDKVGIANSYNNIGTAYQDHGKYPEALKNHFLSLKIKEEGGYKNGIAVSYNNIGAVYRVQGKRTEALENFFAALKIREEIGDKNGIALAYYNIGSIYTDQGELPEALKNHFAALKIREEIGDKTGVAGSCNSIGLVYYRQGKYAEALHEQSQALNIAEEIGLKTQVRDSCIAITDTYKALKDFENALKFYEKYHAVESEMLGEQAQKQLTGLSFQHNLEQKEKDLEIEHLRNVELKKEKETAEEMRLRAEQSEKFKEMFLANMSHELRTPMNAVLGMTNLVLDTALNEKQRNYLAAVKKSSENLLVILNDILDLSKLEAGKMELSREPFRLQEQLDYVKDILKFKAEEKGLKFTVDISPEVPAVLIGDAPRLNQVLINLLGNAIKFTEVGWVQLSVDKDLRFTITDTGIGMTREQMGRIFQSFAQAEGNTSRKYGGTGLGLAISKTLIELQGGHIEVTSEPGKGSAFSFTIPFEAGEEKDINITGGQEETDYSPLCSLKILVAEDFEFNQIVIQDTLETLLPGVRIEIAENGKVAVEKIRTGNYDIVLMDARMPEMDGYEATRYIRNELKSDIPIVALTASVIKSDLDKCTAAGMNGYIPKPFQREELLRELMRQVKPA